MVRKVFPEYPLLTAQLLEPLPFFFFLSSDVDHVEYINILLIYPLQ